LGVAALALLGAAAWGVGDFLGGVAARRTHVLTVLVVSQAIGMAETRKRLEELGYVTMIDTPHEFARFLHEDIEKMAKLIKQYNLKPE